MDDEKLRKLLKDVQEKAPDSPEWRVSMDRLLIKIEKFNGLLKCSHYNYLDALNKTWVWVYHNIRSFEPLLPSLKESLVSWVNSYLYWRIKDLDIENRRNFPSLEELMEKNEEESTSLLNHLLDSKWNIESYGWLENYIEQSDTQKIRQVGLALEQAVEADIQSRLKTIYLQGKPKCNCKLLSQRLLFKDPPDKLTSISRELEANYKTLLSHWNKKCKPCLQKMAIELNYRPN